MMDEFSKPRKLKFRENTFGPPNSFYTTESVKSFLYEGFLFEIFYKPV